jgi:potassium-dependent mechanosensitive channel
MSDHCFLHGCRCAAAALVVLWFPLGWPVPCASAAEEAAPQVAASEASGAPSASTTSTDASLRQKLQELAARRQLLEQTLSNTAQTPTASSDTDTVRHELEVTKSYELVCSQHRAELARVADLQAEIKQIQLDVHDLRAAGPAEAKPYSILLLDDILDQQSAEQLRRGTLTLELADAKQVLQDTRRKHDEAESNRRKAQDNLATSRDQSPSPALTRQLELEQLACQQLAETVQLCRTEIAAKQLEQQINALQLQYLDEKHAAVCHNVVFTQQHLQAVCGEIDKVEAELQAQIPPLQAKLQELETRVLDAQQKSDALDRTLRDAMVEAWQEARQSLQTQIKLIQQRLRNAVLARQLWHVRFQVLSGQGTPEQMADWMAQAQSGYEQIQTTRSMLEDESKALTAEIGRLDKQLRILRHANTDAAKWVEYEIAHMRSLSQAYAASLVQVETFQRTVAKLVAALSANAAADPGARWLSQMRSALASAWNYELTSVDDRPITVRKVTAGLLLCLIGLLVSRWVSRLLARRMLPRLGINSGAAAALSTIAFYVLAASFAFLALDVVRIPLTVFTFLGGAVAIGVGFGSQSILNNFISGLILLAEQPIRVGDLVDIGGLCGNVEKIGARSTRVRTGSNLDIIVPNSKFLEDNVTNWTLTDTRMRAVVKVGVPCGSSPTMVERLLHEAVDECPDVLHDQETLVLFSDFGDSALMFEVHFWLQVHSMMQARRAESDLRFRIDRLMSTAQISNAFPQPDIHLDTNEPLDVPVRRRPDQEAAAAHQQRAA